MKHAPKGDVVWSFYTKRFAIKLHIETLCGYRYVAFDSAVLVYLDGNEIARDDLGGSVYESGKESEFWTEHRGADPRNRNCSLQPKGVKVGHYFPDMVRNAVAEARKALASMPKLRT